MTTKLDDVDRDLIYKVKRALWSYDEGNPLEDELEDESDIVEALRLLVKCIPKGDAKEADLKLRAWHKETFGEAK